MKTEATPSSLPPTVVVAPQRTSLPCAHCGLATPCRTDDDPGKVFCCRGCAGAYELIHGWGLANFYELRDQANAATVDPVSSQQVSFDAFDNEEYLGRSCPTLQADGTQVADLALHGLHCAACAWLIENAAARTPGWQLARVKMSDHTVRVFFDPGRIRLSKIAAIVDRLGYSLAPLGEDTSEHYRHENRKLLTQIAVAGFCAANAMWIAVALYAGAETSIVAQYRDFLRIIGTGLGVAAVAFPGRTFFAGALASLRTRTPHMDLPVALGLTVGTVTGTVSALRGVGDVYFDSLAVLVFLLLIGRWIQFHQQHRAATSIDLLLRLTPQHAHRIVGVETELVQVNRLQIGDPIRVAAGASVPVDGVVIDGDSLLDQSLLTGESEPIVIAAGAAVCAGTINLSRVIDVEVSAIGRDSRIGKVMESVEEATAGKPAIVALGDRVGGVFVIVVTLLAIFTFGSWLGSGLTIAASHATALLIVACPCALALATPLAIAVSLGRAAKHKIMIRDGSVFQRLAKTGTVWFDKTGTLTAGRVQVEFVSGEEHALAWAAVLEEDCCHPIADGIVRLADACVPDWRTGSKPTSSKVELGGVRGTIGGQSIEVGNMAYIQERGAKIGMGLKESADECLVAGASPIVIAVDSVVVAVLKASDPIKPDAKETIACLRQRGWRVGLLSGDHSTIAMKVGKQVGIDPELILGGLSPEQKLKIVRLHESGPTVMIGDGANDAAALAAADVGIALRGGAEVSLQAAPVFVSSGSLGSIVELVSGSRRVMKLIATAFAVSLTYNSLAVGLAMAGHISPLLAAVLMPISSVSVLSLVLAWPTISGAEE